TSPTGVITSLSAPRAAADAVSSGAVTLFRADDAPGTGRASATAETRPDDGVAAFASARTSSVRAAWPALLSTRVTSDNVPPTIPVTGSTTAANMPLSDGGGAGSAAAVDHSDAASHAPAVKPSITPHRVRARCHGDAAR